MISINIKTLSSFLKIGSFLTVLFLSLTSCKKEAVQTLPEREWTLVWSDDFDGAAGTSPDNTKWSFDIGRGNNRWGNANCNIIHPVLQTSKWMVMAN